MIDNQEYIKAIEHNNPIEALKIIKEVDFIIIDGEVYKYCDSEFVPSLEDGVVDVLNIYLDYYKI